MSTNNNTLSIIIPAFNEEESLPAFLEETIRGLSANKIDFQLILVDDGSNDATGDIVDSYSDRFRNIDSVHHNVNSGFGAAIRSGINQAKGAYLTYLPGDGQLEVGQILQLFENIRNADLILGRRNRKISLRRQFMTRVFLLLANLILGLKLDDMIGHFVIKSEIARALELKSQTGVIILEMIMKCSRRKRDITYGNITLRSREHGHSKMASVKNILKTFMELFRLKFDLITSASRQA